MTRKAETILIALFDIYMSDLGAMPGEHMDKAQRWEAENGVEGRARAVADYIAGMTDRYAVSAYQRLVDPAELM